MKIPQRKEYIERLAYESDETCLQQLRMNRSTFVKLCGMLEMNGKLKASKYLKVDEQVAMFLYILAHHVKNRVKPEPIPENSTNDRWKWFKGCLGSIDGTHISVHVREEDKPRYRNRKGEISTNVLVACTPKMQFTYVLPGNYYLVDVGYTNREGFLAPFRGQRYHLSTWRNGRQPEKAEEYFNMKHSSARNVIERCFRVLKKRWAILRSPSFYPIRTQNKIILACCLLHNFIRKELTYDLFDNEETFDTNNDEDDEDLGSEVERITTIYVGSSVKFCCSLFSCSASFTFVTSSMESGVMSACEVCKWKLFRLQVVLFCLQVCSVPVQVYICACKFQ
ncbi:ALP1-like protein isoform X1 [Tanacetum coccineum]